MPFRRVPDTFWFTFSTAQLKSFLEFKSELCVESHLSKLEIPHPFSKRCYVSFVLLLNRENGMILITIK